MRVMKMHIIKIDASGWTTALDFYRTLCTAIGTPEWHGMSEDAFVDTMVVHDDINAVKSPYTIKIVGTAKAAPEAQAAIQSLTRRINTAAAAAAAADYGTDLEVTLEVEK